MSITLEDRWASSFPAIVNSLLNPESPLAKGNPHLHHNLRSRLEGAFISRGYQPLSQCTHTNFDGYEAGRSDTLHFQENEDMGLINRIDPFLDTSETRATSLCADLINRMELYGLAGTGSKLLIPFLFHHFVKQANR
jgi:hypothetical protein